MLIVIRNQFDSTIFYTVTSNNASFPNLNTQKTIIFKRPAIKKLFIHLFFFFINFK